MPTQPLRVAIIGSGLAGSVLADLLAGHHHVTVFERGPETPALPERPATPGHALGLYPSFAYGLGGSTNYWHGGMIELLPDEMGEAWPERLKSELPRYYAQTVKHLYRESGRRAWEGRAKVAPAEGVIPGEILYPRWPPFCPASAGFLTMATLRCGHLVERVEERAGGVDVVCSVNGEKRTEHFHRVVIAAGGINSPLLLHRSGLGGPALGRNLTDHPMGFVAKLRAKHPGEAFRRLRRRNGAETTLVKLRDEATGLWSTFHLRAAVGSRLPSDPYRRSFPLLAGMRRVRKHPAARPQMRDPDFLWQACENQLHERLPSSAAYVLVVNEQEPQDQGSVTADAAGRITVDWHISDDVEAAILRNLDRLAAYTGAELILPEGPLRDRLWSAANYSGTCRISSDIATGVVDENLRVHGARHIYVCDGSVLPSTGSSNTGLTIAALAHRLADAWRPANPLAAATRRRCLFISGANGAVGRMMRARLADLDFEWVSVDLRSDGCPAEARAGDVFLHLANASGSLDENIALQRQAARVAERIGIRQVIVPMSASTIDAIGQGPDADRLNLGFTFSGNDAYPEGKLAAEHFWLSWQKAGAGRKLALVYLPTIMGRRSAWTRNIANHARGKTLLVPRIDRFLAVNETKLVDRFAAFMEWGLPQGVSRELLLSSSGSLADAIRADRGTDVKEVELPGFLWSAITRSYHGGARDKALSVVRVIADTLFRPMLGYAVVPISVNCLHLFRLQSGIAKVIQAVDGVPPGEAGMTTPEAGYLRLDA